MSDDAPDIKFTEEETDAMVQVFMDQGMRIEMGNTYSVRGQIAQLINGIKIIKQKYKSAADEELMAVMGDGAGVYIDRQLKEMVEKILKPIRDVMGKITHTEYPWSDPVRKAINETLRLAETLDK